jgi:hypothetical protein
MLSTKGQNFTPTTYRWEMLLVGLVLAMGAFVRWACQAQQAQASALLDAFRENLP